MMGVGMKRRGNWKINMTRKNIGMKKQEKEEKKER